MKCTYCPNAASNRCLFSHELNCTELVRERNRVLQNVLSIEGGDEIINEVGNVQVSEFHNLRTET